MIDFDDYYGTTAFEALRGQVITGIDKVTPARSDDVDELNFTLADGRSFTMYHQQDCCESVYLAEIVGNLEELIGHPITQAEVVTSGDVESERPGRWSESWTWTFYKIATIKGAVTLRWCGESNGYYSERVTFREVERA